MIKLLKKMKNKELLMIFVAVMLIVFQVWVDLKMPDYMSEITRLVQTDGSKMTDILKNGGYMLLCALLSLGSAILVGYLTSNVSAIFSKNVRKELFDKVLDLDIQEVKQLSTNSLITRTTNDIGQIQMFISMGLQLLIKAPIMAIWAVTKILNKSWQWSMLTGIAVLILLATIAVILLIVMPRFKIVQKLTDKINEATRENLTGIRVIRAFNAEGYQEEKFREANDNLTNTQLFNQRTFAVLQPVMYLVMYFLALFVYFIGAKLIDAAMMYDKLALFSDMIVFSSYSMQVIMSFLMLAMIFMILPRAQVSAGRINEVLGMNRTINDGDFDGKTDLIGSVSFKNVSFKYPDASEYMLKDISFEASSGQTIAFIGSTGSGKSTLINLIPRFYDVTSGEILIDGVNVKEYREDELHNKIGYIPQKALLFSGTIKSNVAYGESYKEITDDDIKKAIEVAQAQDFVLKKDKQYDSHVAQGGINFSGGQKQRLSIARAIARKPEIYIFDDSFSALDYKTDSLLRKKLKEYTKDATILIVAQRIGTIMNADKIIVLDKGVCVGEGTHEYLLKNCEVYKQIALSQLSEEELGNA